MGLIEEVKELKSQVKELKGEEKKPKEFKIPFGKKVSNGQKKKNYVTIIKINENGQLSFIKEQIQEQTTTIDEVPRLATTDHVLFYKKNPFIIQPSWSLEPFSPKQHILKTLEDGSNVNGYRLIANRMELNKTELGKKKMKGWVGWLFGVIVLGIIGYALFTGGI